jgi:hypothetical protein
MMTLLATEGSEQYERSECLGGLRVQPPRKEVLGAQLHAAASIENDKFWVSHISSIQTFHGL